MQKNYWLNKRVLITGSSGFVGRHLIGKLRSLGAKVLGLSRVPISSDEMPIDLTDAPSLKKIFTRFKPTICFHLASAALVEQGQKEPLKTFNNNIISSLNILDLCRIYEVEKIIIASTVHVYGNSPMPYREDEPARPSRPYETSKTCCDLIAQSYADSFNLPVVIPRFVNIYGPGDLNFTRIVPKTIKSIIDQQEPEMWGGHAEREYLYIDDAIDAYFKLAQLDRIKLDKNRIFNFGTGELISVQALIKKIIALSGHQFNIHKLIDGRAEELMKQSASWEKAKKILLWKPKVNLTKGLKATITWYQNYFRLQ